jgi:hypothetical protein
MKKLLKEVYQELILVFRGKTLDTLLPPIVFIVSLNVFTLTIAIIISVSLSFLLWLYRFIKQDNQKYAIVGLLAVGIASFFSLLNNNPATYFIPDILGSGLTLIIAIFSLIINKPLAAYVSHLTRGWPIEWFWRKDVLPAYREVTWFWLLYFMLRTVVETVLFLNNSIDQLVWFNTFIGFPLLIFVLTVSYVYGIWRLHKLNGPGVDEFIEDKEPPYRGQTRGF